MTPTDLAPPPAADSAEAPSPARPDLLAEPAFEEVQAEWIRFSEEFKAGKFNGEEWPEGHYIAYYGGKVHGHDADMIALQHRVAEALGVHWARLVIDYPWMW